MIDRRWAAATAALAAAALIQNVAVAEESQFGYVYTTDLLPKGQIELEQWATWRHQKIGGYFDDVGLRTAFEYGLTDRLQTALYANLLLESRLSQRARRRDHALRDVLLRQPRTRRSLQVDPLRRHLGRSHLPLVESLHGSARRGVLSGAHRRAAVPRG